jgi:excisionase family DNA binding protein
LQIRHEIDTFLAGRVTDETILIYLSCHGIQDERGRLYFAATDTVKKQLRLSAVRAADLLEQLDDCRARRQILILDCCFSGSIGDAKGDLDLEHQLGVHSRGREVLTASRGSEYSYEGKPIDGAITGSVFTAGLVEGLRTGQADTDRDGHITVEEAYQHAFLHVKESQTKQTPQHWLSGGEGGNIVLARSPVGREIMLADLPEHLLTALENPAPNLRIGGSAFAEWRMLTSRDVASILSVPEVTVRAKLREWGLPAYRIGRHLRWRERDVQAWIDRQAIG